MPIEVHDRNEVRALIDRGVQVVEVLGPEDYREDHLPGAINIPLRRLETHAATLLEPSRPVLVYCYDSACDVSPRAAWRLESLGFGEVYDYVPGKVDWLAADLPSEGTNAARPCAREVARRDVPTCRMDESIGDVRRRVRDAGWDACVVVNDERVVFGLLREKELARGGADEPVERVMRPGPSTFRPNVPIEEMAAYMVEHELISSPITSADGRLIGLLRKDDAVRAAEELDDPQVEDPSGGGSSRSQRGT